MKMEFSNIYRDMTLETVGEHLIGQNLKVAGWVENIRDHGGVSFIDLFRSMACCFSMWDASW